MTRSRRLASAATATLLLLLLVVSTASAQQSKFHSSQETGGAPGRYRVEVELRPGDDLVAISGQLAATYGARMEPFAEEGFIGFAIMATPARARLMSSDPRVVAITDLTPPRQPAESVTTVQSQTRSLVAEQVRTVFTSEAVPGLGNYSYDGSGNITSIDNHVFRYDAFGRLQNAFLGSFGSQAYTYDRYGNILKIVTNGDDANAARMSVDPETNQMDLPFSPSNPANMIATYDGVGNVITHNGSFVYDALNMMKETTDTARRLHVYSASDERVMVVQVANGVETTSEWTLRDGANRVLRRLTDSAGVWQWKEDYIYGGSHLLAAEVPGPERVRHFHVDHLGTPRLITGNGGVRIAEKTYAPFGRKVSAFTADFEQLEFTAHERDTPSLDYMHARYYQPDLGRFLSVDPTWESADLGKPQSWNRYSYVLNNPVRYTDPDGRCSVAVIDCVIEGGSIGGVPGALIGAGVGVGILVVGHIEVGDKSIGRHLGDFMLSGSGSSGEMAAETMIDNWAAKEQEAADSAPKKDPKRRFSKADREAGLDKSKDAEGTPRCEYCGTELDPNAGSGNSYESDHRDPHAQGGRTTQENLAPSCRTCNREKGNRTPEQWENEKVKHQ